MPVDRHFILVLNNTLRNILAKLAGTTYVWKGLKTSERDAQFEHNIRDAYIYIYIICVEQNQTPTAFRGGSGGPPRTVRRPLRVGAPPLRLVVRVPHHTTFNSRCETLTTRQTP